MDEEIIILTEKEKLAIDEESGEILEIVEIEKKDPSIFEHGGYSFKASSIEDGLHDAVRNDGIICQVQIVNGELKKIKYS
jgi:hypothetical protein